MNDFEEIQGPSQEDPRPLEVVAYTLEVHPKKCSLLIKQLGYDFPLTIGTFDLSHLKRVRKVAGDVHKIDDGTPSVSTAKIQMKLNVLVGSINAIDKKISEDPAFSAKFDDLVHTFGSMEREMVPGRPPSSKEEWKLWNSKWPTTFFPLQSTEHKEKQRLLSSEEYVQMKRAMENLIRISHSRSDSSSRYGSDVRPLALLVDPLSQKVVATSDEESTFHSDTSLTMNPLETPVLFALQGVSRIERQVTDSAFRALHDPVPNTGPVVQYLCTGYDLYCTYEPNVFEAMSCVHARIRRLVFLPQDFQGCDRYRPPQHNNGCSKHFVHCLPGTNHSYRAFRYIADVHAPNGEN